MATTIAEITKLLDEANLRYRVVEDCIRLYYATEAYEDRQGEDSLAVLIGLEEDGEMLRILAPGVYVVPPEATAETKAAVLATLHQINLESKIHHYEFDQEDGEIRLCVDLPLEDSVPTRLQLERIIRTFPSFIDIWHLTLRDALDEAIVLPNRAAIFRQFDATLPTL